MKATIHWRSRWQREETDLGVRRVLRSREGYRLVHYVKPLPGLTPVVYACQDEQTVISRHYKPQAALRACNSHFTQLSKRRPR